MYPNPEGLRKKPYQLPSLRVYGDVITMTQASKNNGSTSDGKTTKTA